ncbi:MAG: LD-carboxypeptidase [Candidatus Saccharibacteria bacterium]|nr:LD-carboxypeptidase [Candidatus Saccharibacteria bacterium]
MNSYITLPKLKKGDKVAILSPSNGLPGLFPWVQDLGLDRIRTVFNLEPIEYPTTRRMGSSLQDRAADIMAAFGDPSIKAIIASIGGTDQIKLLKLLKVDVIKENPKPFFGFSDNTHLHIYLSNLGIPSYYGGCVMTQFAMQKEMMDITVESLNKALFDGGTLKTSGSPVYNDIGLDWADKESLNGVRPLEKNDRLIWDGEHNASGLLWGGCIESMVAQCSAEKYLPEAKELGGKILFLESAENIPPHWIVKYLLVGLGERGWFNHLNGVMVGRPKAWDFGQQNTADQKAKYRADQREVVVTTIREYNKTIPIVQNVDFGHTDPQIVLPIGGSATLSPINDTITFNYS